jgi:hypothetical protein
MENKILRFEENKLKNNYAHRPHPSHRHRRAGGKDLSRHRR